MSLTSGTKTDKGSETIRKVRFGDLDSSAADAVGSIPTRRSAVAVSSLRSRCGGFIELVFFLIFLSMFLVPLWLSIVNDSESTVSSHLSLSEWTDPILSVESVETGDSWFTFLTDWQRHTISTAQCTAFRQQRHANQSDANQSTTGRIDFHYHSLPVQYILSAQSPKSIALDPYQSSQHVVDETIRLLSMPKGVRQGQQGSVWMLTKQSSTTRMETTAAMIVSPLARNQCANVTTSDVCSVKRDSSPCRLIQRGSFVFDTIYTLEQVYQELISAVGLDMLLSRSSAPYTSSSSASPSSGDVRSSSSSTAAASMQFQALWAYEWHNGSIEVLHAARPTYDSLFYKNALFVKIVDRVNHVLVLKSLSLRVGTDRRCNTDSQQCLSTEDEERELLEYLYSQAISNQNKELKRFVSSLTQSLSSKTSSALSPMAEQPAFPTADLASETESQANEAKADAHYDAATADDDDDDQSEEVDFFVAFHLIPMNATRHTELAAEDFTAPEPEQPSSTSSAQQKEDIITTSRSAHHKFERLKEQSREQKKSQELFQMKQNEQLQSLLADVVAQPPPVLPVGTSYRYKLRLLRSEASTHVWRPFVWMKEYAEQILIAEALRLRLETHLGE